MEIKVKGELHPMSEWQIAGQTSRSRCRVSRIERNLGVDTHDQIAVWFIPEGKDSFYTVCFEGCFSFIQEIYETCCSCDNEYRARSHMVEDLQNHVDRFIERFNNLKVFI